MRNSKRIQITLTYKIFTAMMLIVSMVVVFMSIYSDAKTGEIYERNFQDLYKRMSDQFTDNLSYKFNNYHNSLASMASVSKLPTLLALDFEKDYIQIQELTKGLSDDIEMLFINRLQNDEVINLTVYSYKKDFPIYSSKFVSIENCYYSGFYPSKELLPKTPYFFYENSFKQKVLVLTMPVYQLQDSKALLMAVIALELDADTFFGKSEEIYKEYANNADIAIWVEEEKLWANDKAQSASGQVIERKLPFFGWKVVISYTSQTDSEHMRYRSGLITTALLFILSALILTYIIATRFTGKFNRLIEKINHLGKGYFNTTEAIPGTDEIAIIDGSFNQMVGALDTYIKENFLLKIAQRDAQLNILQNQINPHFLYNTLETIDAMASIRGIFEISEACSRLGQILRYNISKNNQQYSNVSGEITHVKNYVAIQKMRFGSRFELDYDIDEETLTIPILKFILQPIVENAILHSLNQEHPDAEDTKDLKDTKQNTNQKQIHVVLKMQGELLAIRVSDNGRGFQKEVLDKINEWIHNPDLQNSKITSGIGFSNVLYRIKLVYGQDAHINITSKENEGSQIEFILPPIKAKLLQKENGKGEQTTIR